MIDHAVKYVDGAVHTNALENFWSLLKRGLNGTYVSVEPFHLFRYLDEQAFRYNNRKGEDGEPLNDADRFDLAVRRIVGKRLTSDWLTGKRSHSQRRRRETETAETSGAKGCSIEGYLMAEKEMDRPPAVRFCSLRIASNLGLPDALDSEQNHSARSVSHG